MVGRQYSPEHRNFCVMTYQTHKGTRGDIARVQLEFSRIFPNVRIPSRKTIIRLYAKQNTYFTVHNLNSKVSPSPTYSGRPKTATNARNVQNVRAVLVRDRNKLLSDPLASPRNTGRRNSLGLTQSAWFRCVKLCEFHPYKMHRNHMLKAGDYPRRLAMCRSLQQLTRQELANYKFSDEAYFCLNGRVNTQNVRCYSSKRDGCPDHFR